MLDVYRSFATDDNKEVQGVVVNIGSGATITVARSDNRRYEKRILEEMEKFELLSQGMSKEEKEKADKDLMNRILAETVLLGFSGIAFDGKELEYSVANAMKLLEIKDFKRLVLQHARDISLFKVKTESEEVKN